MRVFVYFNLHRKIWSVRALEGENKGRVIEHATDLCLFDCTFKVSEAGRQRVLREKCKNVHAGVVGTIVCALPDELLFSRRITYDPYQYESFVDFDTKAPQYKADWVRFGAGQVHATL